MCIYCAMVFLLAAVPRSAEAKDGFTAADFLKWPQDSRRSYVQNALMMANMIAVENNRGQADCISNWYFSDRPRKDAFIDSVMQKYPTHHPMGVILAVIEKQCGSFKYVR